MLESFTTLQERCFNKTKQKQQWQWAEVSVRWGGILPCTVSWMMPRSSPKELMAWQEKNPESSRTVGIIYTKHTPHKKSFRWPESDFSKEKLGSVLNLNVLIKYFEM